jgi:hypothetical protein
MPIARKKRTSYENFVAECPSCGEESIFNRASDLRSFEPIAGRDVTCLNVDCGKPFRIVGDSINNGYEMLINDCYELIERKHYMNCIINLTTAYEMFFSLFFRVELLFKPFAADPNHDLDEVKRLAEKIKKKIKKYTFVDMRGLFLQHILNARSPKNWADSEVMIEAMQKGVKVKTADIKTLGDRKLETLLKKIKEDNINTLRNRIVHKEAYRPEREDAKLALENTNDILSRLQDYFQLHDDPNCYMT